LEKKSNNSERYDTVDRYVKKVANLKNYGFSEEELAIDVKEGEEKIIIKTHPRLFRILKDFFDKEFELPDFYTTMKNIIGFREEGVIVVEKGKKFCYAPAITRMLIFQLLDKLNRERILNQKKTNKERERTIQKLLSRTEMGLLPCIEKIKRINCYYSNGLYVITIKCKKLKKVIKSHLLSEAHNQITEIEHLIIPFSIKVKESMTEKKKWGYRVVFKITGLTIEFALTQSEAEETDLVEKGVNAAIIPLMQKFSRNK